MKGNYNELRLSQDPVAASDFCRRYGISSTSLDGLKSDIDSGIANEGSPVSEDSPTVKVREEKEKTISQRPHMNGTSFTEYGHVDSSHVDMSMDETWDMMSPDPLLARAKALLQDDDFEEGRDVLAPLKTSTPMVEQSTPLMMELMQRTSDRRQSLDEMQTSEGEL